MASAVALPLAVSPQLVRRRGTPVCRVGLIAGVYFLCLLASVLHAASLIAQIARSGIITPGAVSAQAAFSRLAADPALILQAPLLQSQ